jgi:trehalose 6-phosphate synthase
MSRAARFLVLLLAGLAGLTVAGYQVLTGTTSAWFERDLQLRSELAVASAGRSLVRNWDDRPRLAAVLEDITRDERILGAATCSLDGQLWASTAAFPPAVFTDVVRERIRSMRRLVAEFNVYRWAGRMLVDAAELRRRERLSGRLPTALRSADGADA